MTLRTRKAKPGPDRILLVGIEGVGKTTFAANAPSPVFICAEDGIPAGLDVDIMDGDMSTWDGVLAALSALVTEEHEFKTVAIDTLDWCEPLVCAHVQKKEHLSPKEYDAYGRGIKLSVAHWREMIAKLEALRAKGMEVIVLVHAAIKSFTNPAGDDYKRFGPDLGGDVVANLWKGWADTILFARFQETVSGGGEKRVGKATTDGTRVIYTEWTPAYDAKNRWGLPKLLPLDYAKYAEARAHALPEVAAKLYEEVTALLAKYEGEDKAELAKWVEQNKSNAKHMTHAVKQMNDKLAKQEAS